MTEWERGRVVSVGGSGMGCKWLRLGKSSFVCLAEELIAETCEGAGKIVCGYVQVV